MRGGPHALLVGGDVATRLMVRFLLEREGCALHEAARIDSHIPLPPPHRLALVVVVATEIATEAVRPLAALRRLGYRVPTVLLGHDVGRELRRQAFGLGVCDVVSLPASTVDLQVRLRKALGDQVTAPPPSPAHVVRAGGLTLHLQTREVRDGAQRTVRLTRREMALLHVLMRTPGQAVCRNTLIEDAWGETYNGDDKALDVHVCRLRAKLARPGVPDGYVRTVRKQGYVFDARKAPRVECRQPPSGPPRVLVVDDDPAIRTLLNDLLSDVGYAVTSTVGTEALAMARQTRPALILLDVNMPQMDGMEVRRRLREDMRTAGIPVIALSAGHMLRAYADTMSPDDYLLKPFDVDEVLLRVEKWAGPAIRAGGAPA